MSDQLIDLLGQMVIQSLLAIGGINVILGELQRVLVAENGWLTAQEFTSLFALAQASPGPNTLFVTLIGWRLFGIGGGLAATAVFVAPSIIIGAIVARAWTRWSEMRWFVVLRRGLVPMTVGLVVSSAILLTLAAASGPISWVITVAAATLSLTTRLPPVAILAIAAVVGVAGLG
ncbi:chromate transporter [Alterinioella nitratireducens]|uniref:chromate transporter n=1 Tax=Alterinioella nitratireducens TaxID=2735915 RepID=UPI0015529A5E|nr:chromate transporter [Alterinioella nitratireducens]NPD21238.1 chromate transporter [Alterinioella nitratireducens]